jgi:hypothetical protein
MEPVQPPERPTTSPSRTHEKRSVVAFIALALNCNG